MEAEGGVFDVAGRPAVVVDHRHPVAGLQQLGALHHVGAVGVHHNDQSARPHFQKCLRPGGERPRILRQRLELGQNRSGGVVLQINDHLGPLAVLAGNAVEPRLGAYGIHVRKAVAHDIDLGRVGHQLVQGAGHDPGLHLGALFRGLAAAAVELEVHLSPDHRLVSAPAEGHLQAETGVAVQLRHSVGILANADGEGGAHIPHLDLPNGIQDGELLLHKVVVVAFLKDEEVVVPLRLQQQAVGAGGPVVQLLVDLGQHGAALGIGACLHQVLVVVYHQNGQHRPGGGVPLPQVVGLCGIHPVGSGHQVLLGPPALGPHQAAVHPEPPAVHHHPVRALLLSLQHPLNGEIRYCILHLHLEQVLPHAGQLQEVLIAPDHLAGVRPEHHDGQRRVDEGGFAGGIHAAGDIINVLEDVLPPLLVTVGEIGIQAHGAGDLHQSQRQAHRGGGRREDDHAEEVELEIGLQQAGELLVVHLDQVSF